MQRARGGERKREGECVTKNDFSPTRTERQISLSCSGVLVAVLDSLFPLLLREKGKFLLLSYIFQQMFHYKSYSLTADGCISWFCCIYAITSVRNVCVRSVNICICSITTAHALDHAKRMVVYHLRPLHTFTYVRCGKSSAFQTHSAPLVTMAKAAGVAACAFWDNQVIWML